MFDAISRCASTTTDEFINKHHLRRFAGYDGNNETKFMTFARYMVERLERFEGVPMRETDRWNSHMPIREVYWRMLRAWRQVPSERHLDLTVDEVKGILAETVHPEKR